MDKYIIFTRNWWQKNPSWPNGLEPDGGAPRHKIGTANSLQEAREMCQGYMLTHQFSKEEKLLGRAAEFTAVGNW